MHSEPHLLFQARRALRPMYVQVVLLVMLAYGLLKRWS